MELNSEEKYFITDFGNVINLSQIRKIRGTKVYWNGISVSQESLDLTERDISQILDILLKDKLSKLSEKEQKDLKLRIIG